MAVRALESTFLEPRTFRNVHAEIQIEVGNGRRNRSRYSKNYVGQLVEQIRRLPIIKCLLSTSYHNSMAGPEGFEPPACRLGGGRSIQLSYGPLPLLILAQQRLGDGTRTPGKRSRAGIQPTPESP